MLRVELGPRKFSRINLRKPRCFRDLNVHCALGAYGNVPSRADAIRGCERLDGGIDRKLAEKLLGQNL